MAVRGKTPGKKQATKSSASSRQTQSRRKPSLTIFTVGHSTRPIDEFILLLKAHGVLQLADVRTIPRSRHNPQFGQDQLGPALERAGIRYLQIPGLGGLRHSRRDSVNNAWRNASFRGYADYMQTEPFTDALNELITLARERPTAIMCAEAVPWRCHRSLIADALVARGIAAEEIVSPARTQTHKLTPWAHVSGKTITYPASADTSKPAESATILPRRSPKRG